MLRRFGEPEAPPDAVNGVSATFPSVPPGGGPLRVVANQEIGIHSKTNRHLLVAPGTLARDPI